MDNTLIKKIKNHSYPLRGEKDLDALIERIGDAKIVMLGESTHGTKEFYMWRAEISQRLIKEKGFSFIAVEGDWPDCYKINRYIKNYKDSSDNVEQVLKTFKRWPSWMWANEDIRELAEWLQAYNLGLQNKEKMVGFYGLDVYSLFESMEVIIDYLKRTDSEFIANAYKAYGCFEPYEKEPYRYAQAVALVDASCQNEVAELLAKLRSKTNREDDKEEEIFNAEQNARVAKNAENYYRTMLQADHLAWNIRDMHMMKTLERLLEYGGPSAKAIVWAHNTHVGDARATPMEKEDMINIGQLAREKFSQENVALVGLGAYRGSAIAGLFWGSPMQKMTVPDARRESWEHIFHELGANDKFIISSDFKRTSAESRKVFGQRAIGVVYNPDFESGNYVPTDLFKRYDAFIYLEETRALEPIAVGNFKIRKIPETISTKESK